MTATLEDQAVAISELITSNRLEAAVKLCEEIELDRPGEISPFSPVHLLTLLAMNDLSNARFLWRRTPEHLRTPELVSVWLLATHLWERKFAEFFAASQTVLPQLSPLASIAADGLIVAVRNHVVELLSRAYSAIRIIDVSALIGLEVQAAVERCLSDGWELEGEFLKPKREMQEPVIEVGEKQLEALASFVSHIEEPII